MKRAIILGLGIVVLSGCGQDEADRKRSELQRTVDEAIFEARPGRRLPLAVSIGAAIFPHDGDTYEALLATADSRMYRDKSRRKQQARAAGVNGADARTTTLVTTASIEPTEVEIQRAGRGVL